jgi:transaldolase
MKLFVDTGRVEEVRKAAEWGIVDGVTTNPSLIAQAGRGFKETVLEICSILPNGSISAEVVGTTVEDILREGREIASWSPNIVVKVPMTPAGIAATRQLTREGIRVNMTLVFSPSAGAAWQPKRARATSACSSGAWTMSPARACARLKTPCRLWRTTASTARCWSPASATRCMWWRRRVLGAHIATMPFKVMEQLFQHPLTDIGLQRFLDDWRKAGLRIFE